MNTLAEATPASINCPSHEQTQCLLGAVLKLVPDAIVGTDLDGRITLFNAAAERVFGHSSTSVQGEPIEILIPVRLRAGHREAQQRFAHNGGDTRMMGLRRVKGLRADGQEIDLEGYIRHVKLPQGEWSLVSLHDVTARLQAETQLQHSRAQLAELTRKLMTQERVLVKRLAQVLHDQLGQTLAAIRMCHETIIALETAETPSDFHRLHERLGTLIGQAITQVRQVLVDLRPPLLEEQGLSVALDNELRNRAQAAPQMDITIHVPPNLEIMRWPAEVEYAAFMVVREAVENALRHSGADAIEVDLTGGSLSLHLTVSDNGVGLPEGAGLSVGHLGILGMQERAQAVGASVSCTRAQERGTRVTFHWQCLS
ncbi:PAS domain S-box protein [Rhodoferax sp.]|uniref:PAS domain-containing sensor histidine kinase n=1 Tax=Rhodoferax sp. TaxID=50421 RepID=UPI002604F6AF|nr:PAS domain S-box protein [Rhodoferax sp.]MDD2920139.1 PAS domain S-box protein [Rhodoferax sp.]